MFSGEFIDQIKSFVESAMAKSGEVVSMITNAQQMILNNFGENGLYASYIAVAAILLFVTAKLAKLAYSAAKYLVLPSVVLAFAGSFFMPMSFTALLPVTVAACSLILLFRG